MSIPYWRKAKSTDDGCEIFECLSCYQSWESRTAPGWSYTDYKTQEKIIDVNWHYCPYCGIKWEGQHEWDEEAGWEKKQLRYKAHGNPQHSYTQVEYADRWISEQDDVDIPWGDWSRLESHNFLEDYEFRKFEQRNMVVTDDPNVKKYVKPDKYNDRYQAYLNGLQFANLVLERAKIYPRTAHFYKMTDIFKLRVVRLNFEGNQLIDTKVLWESKVVNMKHKEHWMDR